MKKAVLKNFAIFTGKQLCWSLFLIKLQALGNLQLATCTLGNLLLDVGTFMFMADVYSAVAIRLNSIVTLGSNQRGSQFLEAVAQGCSVKKVFL